MQTIDICYSTFIINIFSFKIYMISIERKHTNKT